MDYELRAPANNGEWAAYHEIRRTVLFEMRGRVGVYDADHPDERRPGNHPLLLLHRGAPVGVIRVDVEPERAIFRRVAVRADAQRLGHGRVLLRLAEHFARDAGCELVHSYVDPGAVGFYERCGFRRESSASADLGAAATVLMVKDLRATTQRTAGRGRASADGPAPSTRGQPSR